MNPVEPIFVADRFPELNAELLSVLWALNPDDWHKPTVCAPWTVKDVAAHLLDVQIRRLSSQRDGVRAAPPAQPVEGFDDLVSRLNAQNADWVRVASRISPLLLTEFIAIVGDELGQFFASLDPLAPAPISVLWAGEHESPNWFDTAREFTELWMHQQHIREAVGQPVLTSHRLTHPVLDTFMRALPHTYRNVSAPEGASVWVCLTGEAGDDWTLVREREGWRLYSGHHASPTARVQMEQDVAWRLFTKGLTPAQARPDIAIKGDETLGAQVLEMVSLMA